MPVGPCRGSSRRPALCIPREGRAAVVNPNALTCAESVLAEAEQRLDGRELDAAVRNFDVAETFGADRARCCAGRWMASMLLGDYASAWRQSDAIKLHSGPDPHRFWSGEDTPGKRLIVRCLHGFGDAVQFLRYAPLLRVSAQSVAYEVPPRMLELAGYFRGVDSVITWGERAPEIQPDWDMQLEIMELPYLFRTTLGDLPIAEKYLDLPQPMMETMSQTLGPAAGLRVGLVWSAGEWNPARSIPFEFLTRLLAHRSCEFWSLQGGAAANACKEIPNGMLRSQPDSENNLVMLAALIGQLDLVITVDTLAAHLAGALGVPAWVLLQYAADWRWMTARKSSPWYPSLRLFRQQAQGDWGSVVDAVEQALHEWSRAAGSRTIA